MGRNRFCFSCLSSARTRNTAFSLLPNILAQTHVGSASLRFASRATLFSPMMLILNRSTITHDNPSRECASPVATRLDCSGFRRPFRMCRLAYAPADLFPLAHGARICDAISRRRRPHIKLHLSPIPPPREYAHFRHSGYTGFGYTKWSHHILVDISIHFKLIRE